MPGLFTDFYRADNVIGRYEGSGLGLSIVKKLVDYNKGAIQIRSKVGKGTTVDVTLPIPSSRDVRAASYR